MFLEGSIASVEKLRFLSAVTNRRPALKFQKPRAGEPKDVIQMKPQTKDFVLIDSFGTAGGQQKPRGQRLSRTVASQTRFDLFYCLIF